MVSKIKQRTIIQNQVPVQGTDLTATSANNVTAGSGTRGEVRRMRLKLAATVAAVLAINDFGSVKLCDLPNSNLIIVGTVVDLDATVAGTGSSLAAVDLAIGTVLTASAAFSNAGEKDLCPKIDCTAGGVIEGVSGQTETNIRVAAGASNAIYANVATGNITTDGSVTLTGFVDIFYIDLGKAA